MNRNRLPKNGEYRIVRQGTYLPLWKSHAGIGSPTSYFKTSELFLIISVNKFPIENTIGMPHEALILTRTGLFNLYANHITENSIILTNKCGKNERKKARIRAAL